MDRERVFAYIEAAYGIRPEYLWLKYPDYAVFRHDGGGKWFAIVMDVPKNKLGLAGDGSVDVLDLKCDPLLIGSLRAEPGFLPGYHMNKEHWITVVLDGSVPEETIRPLIDLSYEQTIARKRKPKRHPGGPQA